MQLADTYKTLRLKFVFAFLIVLGGCSFWAPLSGHEKWTRMQLEYYLMENGEAVKHTWISSDTRDITKVSEMFKPKDMKALTLLLGSTSLTKLNVSLQNGKQWTICMSSGTRIYIYDTMTHRVCYLANIDRSFIDGMFSLIMQKEESNIVPLCGYVGNDNFVYFHDEMKTGKCPIAKTNNRDQSVATGPNSATPPTPKPAPTTFSTKSPPSTATPTPSPTTPPAT